MKQFFGENSLWAPADYHLSLGNGIICKRAVGIHLYAILTECGGIFYEIHAVKMTLKYAKYIHDAEMEKFILTRLCQFGGHQIRNSANLQV